MPRAAGWTRGTRGRCECDHRRRSSRPVGSVGHGSHGSRREQSSAPSGDASGPIVSGSPSYARSLWFAFDRPSPLQFVEMSVRRADLDVLGLEHPIVRSTNRAQRFDQRLPLDAATSQSPQDDVVDREHALDTAVGIYHRRSPYVFFPTCAPARPRGCRLANTCGRWRSLFRPPIAAKDRLQRRQWPSRDPCR